MKKFAFLALMAALVLAVALPAMADTKIGGSYQLRGIYWDQGFHDGKADGGVPAVGRYFDNRLRLDIDSKVSDCLAVHIQADSGLGYNGRNGDFQNPAATPDSYNGIMNAGSSFVNVPMAGGADRDLLDGWPAAHDIVFQQVYMDFTTPIGAFSLGRQWAYWGLGLMVGENRNRLAWSYQAPGVQVGAGYDKVLESNQSNRSADLGFLTKSDDQDNYFAWLLLSGKDWQLGPYFEYSHADKIAGGSLSVGGDTALSSDLNSVNTYGVSIYGTTKVAGINLGGEFAYRGGNAKQNDGDNVTLTSYAVVGRGSYALPMCTVGAEGGWISGQDPNQSGSKFKAFLTPYSFSPFAILGEFAINGGNILGQGSVLPESGDTAGSSSDFLSNIIYGKAYIQASPMPKLDAYFAVGYAVAQQNNIHGKSNLGTEADLSLTYAIMPNLTYNFTAGYLFTGDFWDNPVGGSSLGTTKADDALLAVHSISVNF